MSPPTIAKLNDENYTNRPVSDTRPVGSDNTRPVRNWREKNSLARAEIILNIEPAHSRLWHPHGALAQLLAHGEEARLTSWIADVRRAARTLEEIDAPIVEEHTILVLTNGLPDTYSQVIVSFDSTPETDLSLEHVIQRLINEESRIASSIPPPRASSTRPPRAPDDVALAATMKPRTPLERITCFKCAKKGHYQRDCPQLKTETAAIANTNDAAW
ncbi:hypothetical protein FKP32DRAFT_1679476 [Trametes sanguinea]|nr:hypothetical protein FKP32DRAFT_1679476 [Trametes sanguinea]